MDLPALPPKYYLNHFFEFLDFLETHYWPILQEPHRKFLADFRAMSEDAQCVVVRLLNRKGRIFPRTTILKYKEIHQPLEALNEAQNAEFIGSLKSADKSDLLASLTKTEIRQWLGANDIPTQVSSPRKILLQNALSRLDQLDLQRLCEVKMLVALRRTEVIEYLLFLYFGRLQKSLNLYTLRDLGIRRSNTLKTDFRPRFTRVEEAEAEYFFAVQLAKIRELNSSQTPVMLLSLKELVDASKRHRELRSSAQTLKNELLLNVADLSFEQDTELALEALYESKHPAARERATRALFKLARKEESRQLLEQMIQAPRSDAEFLFAKDFLARKFGKKRVGHLTEVLQRSQELVLSDVYLKRPEQGVKEHYRKLGFTARFTENYLWMGLFGVLFWDELFESEDAGIHNPFERSPANLVGPDFYHRNQASLEGKLMLLKDPPAACRLILKSLTRNYGRLNDVFQWRPSMSETLLRFIQNSAHHDVARVLRTMSQQFESYHSGFPDLMVEKQGHIKFIEVKAEGDSLRASQLAKIRLLKESGFEVEILRVRWKPDPQQTYVVLDVETTGGSAAFHRITEIGAVKMQNGEIIDEFQTLINPERSIPAFITKITGITNTMVTDAPHFRDVADKLFAFLEDSIFVGHNVRFDYGFIQKEFARAGIEFTRPRLCTCSGMRKAFPGIASYSLKSLAEHFEIPLEQHHRAMSDARAAAQLLRLMNSKREDLKPVVEKPTRSLSSTIDER